MKPYCRSMIRVLIQTILVGSLLSNLSAQAQQETQYLPNEVTINGIELVLIPEGWFYKSGGVRAAGDDEPYTSSTGGGNAKIWLDSYYIAKYEARATDLVTLLNTSEGQHLDYDGGEENCAVRKNFWGRYERIRATEDLPATHLSWSQANSFAQWKGMRLPSEAEWEKAARGTDQRRYPWGDEYPDETYANFETQSGCFTWPVDRFKKGRSPYGIHNMAGNIYEFTADWYSQEYDEALRDGMRNPAPASKESTRNNSGQNVRKVLKGGRWASNEDELRISSRYTYPPDQAFRCYGARFAMDVASVREHLNNGTAEITRQ